MKRTKTKLVSSIVTLLICFAMLIGSTFAWFTDSASTGVNKIQAGNLDVALEMSTDGTNWVNAEGKTLTFKTPDNRAADKILWEPGCTYVLPELRIVNKGNLNLKYKIEITGIKGDAKLNEVIEWTINDAAINLTEEHLPAGQTGTAFTIKGHMQETAGNEYKNLTIDGISITVYATQDTGEYDSFGNSYDAGAKYVKKTATIMDETDGKTYTLESGKTYPVGYATVTVADNGDITYSNLTTNTQTVSITTNGGKLTVDAPNDTVNHYGEAEFVDVNAIANNSFHEFGKVDVLSIKKGRVVAENGNNINVIQVKGEETIIAVPENKTLETKLEKASNVTNVVLNVIDSKGTAVESKSINTPSGIVDGSIPEELKEVLVNTGSSSSPTIENAKDYVARVGNNYYDFLDEAINKASSDSTITLLKDSAGNGIGSKDGTKARESLTIDFNGYTYTMNGNPVGSTGTESQAMHWGKSLGVVTLKNGTFKVAENTTGVKMAMQNYINFTAENMTFDFTTIPVNHYGNNFTGSDAVYNGLEIPLFNNGNGGTMTLKNSTVYMPENSIKGIDNYGKDLIIESSTINGAVVIEYENSTVKVKDSVITKGVSPYLNSGYTVKTSETDDGYTVYTNQTVVNISNTKDLTNAINQNSEVTVKLTTAGTYELPKMIDKEVSIIGTKDTVIDMENKVNNAKSISFEGVTVNFGTDNYCGFQHTGKLTYKDCTITGMQFLYADEVEFNNCVFEQDGKDYYNVWTYGAKNVLFKDCTFNCAGKSVLIYNEGANGQTVEFKNCKFNATASVVGKAAIEIDSSLLKNDDIYTVIIDQATANSVSGFSTGSVSKNSVWNNKKGNKATVIVAGSTVLSAN